MRLAERAEALVLIEDVLAMLDEHEGGAGGGASAGAAAWETAMEEVLVHVIQIVEALELDVVAVNQQERRGAAGAGPRSAPSSGSPISASSSKPCPPLGRTPRNGCCSVWVCRRKCGLITSKLCCSPSMVGPRGVLTCIGKRSKKAKATAACASCSPG